MDLGIKGRRAVVTGGSKGLGRAIALELAAEGADLSICARNADEVEAAAEELRQHGNNVFAQTCDVTKPEQVQSYMAASADALGGIDILVNNAGGAHPGTFETLTDEAWHSDLDVKLFSMIRCSRSALPHLRKSEAARIININAVQAKSPDPKFFATSTNRAACLAFTKALALELAPENILVTAVNIGFVKSPQWKNIHQKRAPEMSEQDFFDGLAASEIPLGRFGEDTEVSAVVAFLASSRATFITGTWIDVAGGMGRYV
jgi:3-oxoacyl-[acyl-carrier protein] reductase